MAKLGGAKGFWNTLKSVSVAEVAKEAHRPVSVALVGEPEQRAEAARALFATALDRPEELGQPLALPEPSFVQSFDSTSEEEGFPQQAGVFDFVIDMGGGRRDAPEGTLVYSVSELGGWEPTLERILEDRPELALPLARNFPVFRRPVSQRIITETALANAQFALLTGITEAFPLTSFLLPVNSLSDIVMLTKNQTMMALRLAAAHGLAVDYKSRLKEIAPILGNAFGWRAIARELLGAVPFVGFVARAMIAYAGTVTVGKGVQYYYETGENLTSAQARRLYRDAYETSREKVRQMADTLRTGKGKGKRLPAGNGNGAHPSDETPLLLEAHPETEKPGPHDPLKQLPE